MALMDTYNYLRPMYSAPKMATKYVKYWFKSQNHYYLHSPFVYSLVSEVIYNKEKAPIWDKIEAKRKALQKDKTKVKMIDFGAKELRDDDYRTVAQIATSSAKPARLAQCLYRLVNHFQPKNMIELGSSLGVSTIYQSCANPEANFTTMEGSPAVAEIAQKNIKEVAGTDVNMIVGNFDKTLDEALEKYDQLDYVFFDGNHQEKPTIEYFEKCLKKAHNDTLFIFDDIHWSKGMENAWDYIKAHPGVTVTLDMFFIGLVFFRKEQAKQDFLIRF